MEDYDKRKAEVRPTQLFPSVTPPVQSEWLHSFFWFVFFVTGSGQAERGGQAAGRGRRGVGESLKGTKGHKGPTPQRGGQQEDSSEREQE